MFKRKTDLSLLFRMKAFVWPDRGWDRRLRYFKHRIVRDASSTYGVAAGLACGMCVSFTPFLGAHLALTWAYCKVVRGNILSGMIGTLVGNPLTFPPMYYLSYKVGAAILSSFDWEGSMPPPGEDFWQGMMETPMTFIQQNLNDVFLPTAVGGTLLAFGLFPLAFAAAYPVGRAAKALNKKRRQRRWKKAHPEWGGPKP